MKIDDCRRLAWIWFLAAGALAPQARAWTAPAEGLRQAIKEFKQDRAERVAHQGRNSPMAGLNKSWAHLKESSSPGVALVVTNHGGGSGFIVDPSGLVATNHHVIAEALSRNEVILVRLPGHKEFSQVDVAGANELQDLALLKLRSAVFPRPKWPALSLGDSTKLEAGHWVMALGYPLGLDLTATRGIISAMGRNTAQIALPLIQTDAAINPGNSGGPLVDVEGKVVGINVMIATVGGGSDGLGFAIPVERLKHLLARHRRGQTIASGWLGAVIGASRSGQVQIAKVERGSPAARAGLRAGDAIMAIDGKNIARNEDQAARARLTDKFAGDKVVLAFRAQTGELKSIEIALE